MYFVCHAFDVAPKEVVWYCKSRWMGGPGVPGTPEGIRNLKTCLHNERCFTEQHHAQRSMEQLLIWHRLPCRFSWQWFQPDYLSLSHSTDNTWPACSPDLAVPACCLWGYVKSIQNTSCQVGSLKQQILLHSQGISKEMLQCVVTPKKCPIQTVKINMNSYQYEMPRC